MLVAGLELSKISLILRNAVGLAACVWHSPNVHVLSRYVCALDQIRIPKDPNWTFGLLYSLSSFLFDRYNSVQGQLMVELPVQDEVWEPREFSCNSWRPKAQEPGALMSKSRKRHSSSRRERERDLPSFDLLFHSGPQSTGWFLPTLVRMDLFT